MPDFTSFIVPPWMRLAGIALAAAFLFSAGMALEGELKDGEIAEIQLAHKQALADATKAKMAAEEAVRVAENKAARDLATLSDNFTKEQEHEKTAANQRIADLLSANVRLRVAVQRPAAGSCAPGGPTPAASVGDGQATEALAPATAGRLARRYADYNAIVDQLSLCQATIEEYLELAGPKQ